jgi:hypothetical protein
VSARSGLAVQQIAVSSARMAHVLTAPVATESKRAHGENRVPAASLPEHDRRPSSATSHECEPLNEKLRSFFPSGFDEGQTEAQHDSEPSSRRPQGKPSIRLTNGSLGGSTKDCHEVQQETERSRFKPQVTSP